MFGWRQTPSAGPLPSPLDFARPFQIFDPVHCTHTYRQPRSLLSPPPNPFHNEVHCRPARRLGRPGQRSVLGVVVVVDLQLALVFLEHTGTAVLLPRTSFNVQRRIHCTPSCCCSSCCCCCWPFVLVAVLLPSRVFGRARGQGQHMCSENRGSEGEGEGRGEREAQCATTVDSGTQ